MRRWTIMTLLTVALGVTSCAYYDDYAHGFGDYRYDGSRFGSRDEDRLDPWLAETPEGREIVRLGFVKAPSGRIDDETAHRANIWFRRYADTNRDLRLTDEEIRIALVQATLSGRRGGY